MMQANFRRYAARKRYVEIQRAVLIAQTYARRALARRLATRLRHTRAAVLIQTFWRGYSARQIFQQKKKFIGQLQAGK